MNVGILSREGPNGDEDDWSADSDPDSPLGSSDFVRQNKLRLCSQWLTLKVIVHNYRRMNIQVIPIQIARHPAQRQRPVHPVTGC
jgi:hypothetical protein